MSSFQIKGYGAHVIINVMCYENKNAVNPSDANWLTSVVDIDVGSFRGHYTAALTTHDFSSFKNELDALLEGGKPEAVFSTDEGWLQLEIKIDSRGVAKIMGIASANNVPPSNLQFSFETDQASLRETLNSTAEIVGSFPVKR